jgi:hypothetical protein
MNYANTHENNRAVDDTADDALELTRQNNEEGVHSE